MNVDPPFTPVVIVSYRTPDDVAACLISLDALRTEHAISVYICENGGAAAWTDLCAALVRPDGACTPAEDLSLPFMHDFNRIARLRLRQSGRSVVVGCALENFGYAGGINAWLMPLMRYPGWHGCWILNPDTVVAPEALTALMVQAVNRDLGMVGSRLIASPLATRIINRGLHWRPVLASTSAVDLNALASVEPDSEATEALLDAPSGASLYLTRACAEALVPLDERYFLYYEDVDCGVRARLAGFRLGYAHNSVVVHPGGRSIGSQSSRYVGSSLAIYLEFRNRLLFVRTHYPRWLMWTALMSCLHALRLFPRGGFGAAARGLRAGLRGETGRPDWLLARHVVPGSRDSRASASRQRCRRCYD
jgi:GT2 family glycosyltransferase